MSAQLRPVGEHVLARVLPVAWLGIAIGLAGCIATDTLQEQAKKDQEEARETFDQTRRLDYDPDYLFVRYDPADEQGFAGLFAPSALASASWGSSGSIEWQDSREPGMKIVRFPGKALEIREALMKGNNDDLPQGSPERDFVGDLLDHVKVAGAELDYEVRQLGASSAASLFEPDDPYYREGLQWGLERINAPRAWDTTQGDAKVVVAVLDGGFDLEHPDLVHRWARNSMETANGVDDDGNGLVDDLVGWDFADDDADPSGNLLHATHVAGTIGAEGNNRLGGTGVCIEVSILPIRILDGGSGYLHDVVPALFYAVDQGANVINCSWGFRSEHESLREVFQTISEHTGVVVVAAAGNQGENIEDAPVFPAAYHGIPNLIAVGATDATDSLAAFSNYSRELVEIAAPGANILSTVPPGDYVAMSGTSMAAPMVSGAVALAMANSILKGLSITVAAGTATPPAAMTEVLAGASADAKLTPFVQGARRLDLGFIH